MRRQAELLVLSQSSRCPSSLYGEILRAAALAEELQPLTACYLLKQQSQLLYVKYLFNPLMSRYLIDYSPWYLDAVIDKK